MEATKENIEMLQKVLEHLEGLPDFDEWILQQDHRLPSFQCINFPVWERLWDENTDIIGRSVLVYAHHLAWYIEAEVFKAQKFEFVSTHDMEVCIHNANEYIPGISSANHLDAVNILRHVWRYGEALNDWYDRERDANKLAEEEMYKPASIYLRKGLKDLITETKINETIKALYHDSMEYYNPHSEYGIGYADGILDVCSKLGIHCRKIDEGVLEFD